MVHGCLLMDRADITARYRKLLYCLARPLAGSRLGSESCPVIALHGYILVQNGSELSRDDCIVPHKNVYGHPCNWALDISVLCKNIKDLLRISLILFKCSML